MTLQHPIRIGWVGVGKMGAPMCRRLLDGGHSVSAFDTDAVRLAAIEQAGARRAGTLEDLIRNAEVLISTVPDDSALEALVFGAGGLQESGRTDQLLIEMSTVSPALSARTGIALAGRGILYLRAPVSGSTVLAQTGELTVFASGPPEACSRAAPLLREIATRIVVGGGGDEARYLKLMINLLVGATPALVGEALAFGREGGLGIDCMLDAIDASVIMSPLLRYKRDMVTAEDFTPAFSVAQMMKDLDLVLAAARDEHVPMPFAASIRQLYEAAYARALGKRDFFVLCGSSQNFGKESK